MAISFFNNGLGSALSGMIPHFLEGVAYPPAYQGGDPAGQGGSMAAKNSRVITGQALPNGSYESVGTSIFYKKRGYQGFMFSTLESARLTARLWNRAKATNKRFNNGSLKIREFAISSATDPDVIIIGFAIGTNRALNNVSWSVVNGDVAGVITSTITFSGPDPVIPLGVFVTVADAACTTLNLVMGGTSTKGFPKGVFVDGTAAAGMTNLNITNLAGRRTAVFNVNAPDGLAIDNLVGPISLLQTVNPAVVTETEAVDEQVTGRLYPIHYNPKVGKVFLATIESSDAVNGGLTLFASKGGAIAG